MLAHLIASGLVSSLLAAADLVVLDARLPTVGDGRATSLAVEKGRIVALGPAAEVERLAGPATRRIEGRGRLLLPGLIDSHIHFVSGGLSERRVHLEKARTPEEAVALVKAWAEENPKSAWVTGRGWSYDLFAQQQPPYPSRRLLDAVLSDRPVYLSSYDGHSAWVNSKALEAAGIGPETRDPPDGHIVREKDGRTPHGALLEGAMDWVAHAQPKLTLEERKQALLTAQAVALRAGLTAVNDFAADLETADAYLALEKEGLLRLRVFFSPPLETPLETARALRDRLAKESQRVRFGSLKGFVDGVIESRTAVLLEPYADGSKTRGEPHLSAADLDRLIQPLDKEGFTVSLHAVGDGAVRACLDAFERAAKVNGTRDRRHRIEHIEVLSPRDAARFARLGVVASMQPFHAEPADKPGHGAWETKVGPGGPRWPHIFPWRELLRAGAPLAFGSDWAVMSLDPLQGLAVAVSRRNGHGLPTKGWEQTQTLRFEEAVAAYTAGAAWALHADKELGALEIGRAADFVVLGEKVAADEPLSMYWGQVDLTVVGGVVVSERGR